MDKPTRPPNTLPFSEPAFYVDPRLLARQTVEAAKAHQAAQPAKQDVKQPRNKKA